MSDNNQNLTVLVKKKDGTFERVPLSDLKNKTANQNAAQPTPIKSLVKTEDFDKVPDTRKLSPEEQDKKIAPIKITKDRSELFGDKEEKLVSNKVSKSQVTDFKNPLEDALPNNNNPRLPNDSVKTEQAKKLISSLSFKVTPDLNERLLSAALLFLKDIRSKNQTQDILSRPVRAGGLDLSADNIKEFFDKALSKTSLALSESHSLMKEGELELATAAPFNAFIHDKLPPLASSSTTTVRTNLEKDIFGLQSQPVKKIRMNDVLGTEKIYGPVEEINNFSLVDLRRLSSSSEDAVSRLEQKFINIKTESVILYFQALSAWQKSPLYLDYINALVKSLKENLSLEKVLQINANGLKLAEINLLIKMGENLEI